uniref:Facilitated trehalose transporter Tret1 n=1 Tax=Cacopsylla melanoneura TaxID=428564 RepID=A0A8D8Z9I6_9HEMI
MLLGHWLSDHKVRQYAAAWSWNLGGMNLGIYLGWSSVAAPMLQSETSPVYETPLTDEELSCSASLPFIVAICFAMPWGYIANTLGRKITGCLTALCYILCFATVLKTKSPIIFILGRMIGGIAYCPTLFNGPMYIAEIAEPENIGRMSATYLISENFGTLMIYIIGGYVSFYFLNVFCMVFGFLSLVIILLFPESPVYYLKNDRPTEARLALQYFRPKNNETYLDNEMKRLNDTFILAKKMKLKFLFTKHTLMAMIIALYLQFGVQMTGINYITMYTVPIFQRTASLIDPYISTSIAGIIHTIAPCLYFIIVKYFGRKTIAVWSYTLQALVWATLGGYYFYIEHHSVDKLSSLNYFPLICISLFFLTYSSGGGAIPFTIYSEIFSSEVRNTVLPFIYVWNALISFCVLKLIPTFVYQTIHLSGVFWVFSVSCFLTVAFTLVFIPETKGKSFLTIIDDLTKKAWWK